MKPAERKKTPQFRAGPLGSAPSSWNCGVAISASSDSLIRRPRIYCRIYCPLSSVSDTECQFVIPFLHVALLVSISSLEDGEDAITGCRTGSGDLLASMEGSASIAINHNLWPLLGLPGSLLLPRAMAEAQEWSEASLSARCNWKAGWARPAFGIRRFGKGPVCCRTGPAGCRYSGIVDHRL